KFLTNSKRLSLGNLYEPLPTYANAAILEGVCPKLDTLFPCDFTFIDENDLPLPVQEDYDYGCDSDIDDDEGVIEDASSEFEIVGPTGSNREEIVRSPSPSADSMADSEIIENAISAQHCRHDAVAELVQVKCAAHRTWRAFVFYCYTGQVAFNPIKSQIPLGPPGESLGLSVEDLKKRAFDAVKAGLSEHNIVEEALSYFTS
ncbi:hypothetical protein BU15DRAFT_69661, partial [Melanogaster broomeanus]